MFKLKLDPNTQSIATIVGAGVIAVIAARAAAPDTPAAAPNIVNGPMRVNAGAGATQAPPIDEEIPAGSKCLQKSGTFKRENDLKLDGCDVLVAERPAARVSCDIGDQSSIHVRRTPGTDTLILIACELNVPNAEWDGPEGGPREREERSKKAKDDR